GREVTRNFECRDGIFLRHVEHSYITFPHPVRGGQCVLFGPACSLRGRVSRLIESPLGLAGPLFGQPSRMYRNVTHAIFLLSCTAVPAPYIGSEWCSATRRHK